MKHFNTLCIVALVFVGFHNLQAQDKNNPWQIGFGANAIDFFPTNDPENQFSGKWFDEYFNVDDHWNIIPTVSYLSVSRYLGAGFSIGARGSLSRISNIGDASVNDLEYYAADGTIKYNFLKNTIVDPFLEIGGGYTSLEDIGVGTVNGGVGFNIWLSETIGFTLQSQYKHVLNDEDLVYAHFQHLAGFNFRFGGTQKDRDGDGVYDEKDECPGVPGLRAFDGCPDTDNDGIEDSKDNCPTVAGTEETFGCPDADGDSITDEDDACPNIAGSQALKGCPDTDSDGIADKHDKCPEVPGFSQNNGCPWIDKDGDSVSDKDDKCPEVPGSVANEGCPEIVEKIVELPSTRHIKTILFDTDKATIKPKFSTILTSVVRILSKNSNASFSVEGHADSVGNEAYNQRLSEARAMAVKEFLVKEGVEKSKLSTKGYGESRPVATNDTPAGREQNRRVEINMVK